VYSYSLCSSPRSTVPHAFNLYFFFFNDPATIQIYTLSLHDALPISLAESGDGRREDDRGARGADGAPRGPHRRGAATSRRHGARSEEHTSELQSRGHLVCRLLLEKKKKLERHSVKVAT